MNSFKGKLLIASPKLADPRFKQTVVFLLQDDENGSVGVVLNRPAGNRTRAAWNEISDGWASGSERVFEGGPMPGPIVAIHTVKEFGEMNTEKGIYATTTKPKLRSVAGQDSAPCRIFFGLTGWQPGQLLNEIDQGVWLTLGAKDSHLFAEHTNLWKETLREVGLHCITRVVGEERIPQDVTLN